jgi:hypothetical protein
MFRNCFAAAPSQCVEVRRFHPHPGRRGPPAHVSADVTVVFEHVNDHPLAACGIQVIR